MHELSLMHAIVHDKNKPLLTQEGGVWMEDLF